MRYAHFMKRTTVMLPDATLARLRQESRRQGSSVAEIVRTAVERHLAEPEQPARRNLPFFAIGESGLTDGARNLDEHLGEIYLERERQRRADQDARS